MPNSTAEPALILDRSAFYPTSGGQPYDTGARRFAVVDVVAADGAVYHILDRRRHARRADHPRRIDWPRRHDHMQQHSGQHFISQVFHQLFGFETVSVHFGADESTLDLDAAEVTPEQLDQAELLANDLVIRAIPIKTYFVGDAEIDQVPCAACPRSPDRSASSRSRR